MDLSSSEATPRVLNLRNSVQIRCLLDQAVNSLPIDIRQKGWELVAVLDENKVRLSEIGEYYPVYSKYPIKGSSIQKLLLYILVRSGVQPTGFSKFLRDLKRFCIPDGVIDPKHLKDSGSIGSRRRHKSNGRKQISSVTLPIQCHCGGSIGQWQVCLDKENLRALLASNGEE